MSEPVLRAPVPRAPLQSQARGDITEPSLHIALLTGGQDRHYAVGLARALMDCDVVLDVIGSDETDGSELQNDPRVRHYNLHGTQQGANLARRVARVVLCYARLLRYALTAKPRIFHILWNNKLPLFDRTLLMLLYKMAGRRVVLTAHNVNAGRRDGTDSWLNRLTLKCQYRLADHVFVHTQMMKDELLCAFGVNSQNVTTIRYGINNVVPLSDITTREARRTLGVREAEKVILYFGAIKQYKGLEHLVVAFQQIAAFRDYRLIIAGERKKGHEAYWQSIQHMIERGPHREKVLRKIEFVPDAETEIYFKAADVAVLPYTDIFQSGILFLAYAFGLPVIATDVGSFSDDIVEGRTGFLCKRRDPDNLAATVQRYFESELYQQLERRRQEIRDYAFSTHSWGVVADVTRDVYSKLLKRVS